MNITERDQYIPEKELGMNFRIPRKRTAEESFGVDANYGEPSAYGANSAYGSLSRAASRASNYSNYRSAVSYPMPVKTIPDFDRPINPPMISTNQNMSIGSAPFFKRSLNEDEYQKRFRSIDENQAGSNWGYSGENRSLGLNSNSGYGDRPWSLPSNSDRDISLLRERTEVKGPGGEVFGERRSFLQKPLGFDTKNTAGNSFIGSSRFNEGFDAGKKFNEGFSVRNKGYDFGNTFNERNNGGNSFDNFKNSDNSSNKFNNGGNFLDKFNSSDNSFNKRFNDDNSFNRRFNDDNRYNAGKIGLNNGGFGGSFNRGPGGFNRRGFESENNTNQGYSKGDGKFNKNARYWNKSEKPKIPKPYTPPVVIPDVTDKTLPEELRKMFQPLFCKLCSIQMTSNIMAKLHYVSKNHEKKIRKYLIDHGEPEHPRVLGVAKEEKEEDKDPKHFYCDICDLPLTGKQHADSHYMGKSHNAVRMGKKRPHGKGYFDPTGKWIRLTKETKPVIADGDDTFGMDFREKKEGENAESAPKTTGKSLERFTCSLCIVSCISQEQLNIHLGGSKHKKKLKLKGLSPESFTLTEDSEQQNKTEVGAPSIEIDESLKGKYMTPNGFFYCETCNLSVNSEIQFKQHLASKKHANKVNAKKQDSSVV